MKPLVAPIFPRHAQQVFAALVAVIWGCGWIDVAPASAELIEIAPAERLQINTKLRSKVESTRLEAIERLAQAPNVDSLRLMIDVGLADSAEGVQLAAYRAVEQFIKEPETA